MWNIQFAPEASLLPESIFPAPNQISQPDRNTRSWAKKTDSLHDKIGRKIDPPSGERVGNCV